MREGKDMRIVRKGIELMLAIWSWLGGAPRQTESPCTLVQAAAAEKLKSPAPKRPAVLTPAARYFARHGLSRRRHYQVSYEAGDGTGRVVYGRSRVRLGTRIRGHGAKWFTAVSVKRVRPSNSVEREPQAGCESAA